ncbi:MAG: gamma-glutamyltransferase, partial [Candidatus Obscuribacterales bacterium]|nr:gamma-glutamyltransferase [Candidatus Obscuribacterales bacterium]
TDSAPWLSPVAKSCFESHGIDCSADAQLSHQYAHAVAPLLDQVWNTSPLPSANHSNAIVVIDNFGNIATITHSINTVTWGDTGIVVGGVPITDAAGFQQQRLSSVKPGERLPHEMPQTICFHEDKPVLATAGIGASMIPETIRTLVGVIGKGMKIDDIQSAPPLIYNYMNGVDINHIPKRGVVIPQDLYSSDFQQKLGELVEKVHLLKSPEIGGFRGTVAAVSNDEQTGEKHSAETENMLIFAGASE